jgi:EpsI family protein
VVNTTTINSRAGSLLLWSWYCVNGEFTANGYREKIQEARVRLQGRRQGSALIVLATDSGSDEAQAAAVLQDFLDHSSLGADLLPLCQ